MQCKSGSELMLPGLGPRTCLGLTEGSEAPGSQCHRSDGIEDPAMLCPQSDYDSVASNMSGLIQRKLSIDVFLSIIKDKSNKHWMRFGSDVYS